MACDRCRDLHQVRKIDIPQHLTETMIILKDHIERSALVEIRNETDPLQRYNRPFSQLSPDGPWPDHVSYTFACTECHAQFELSVETYHGRGGEWRPR